MIVVDSTIVVASLVPERRSTFAEQTLGDALTAGALAPALMPFEVTSAMARKVREGQVSIAESDRLLRLLDALDITLEDHPDGARAASILGVARTTGLKGYDAAFLELAIRSGTELATLDEPLANAARASGVTVRWIA